ncbi:hypothetical protein D1871_14770 [Nakamurella silvestris]|nr:hypothetical protein D1871_14770 [Nakamurella silvestris]
MRLPPVSALDLLQMPVLGVRALQAAIGLVPRVVQLVEEVDVLLGRVRSVVGEVENIVGRVSTTIGRVDAVIERAEGAVGEAEVTIDRARAVVTEASRTQEQAGAVVDRAAGVTARVEPIVDAYVPLLDRLEPMVRELAETTTPAEIRAIAHLIDTTPELVDKMVEDILPTLDTLTTVAPDLRDLLEVSKELNEILGSLPGIGRIKRRVEEEQARKQAERDAAEN